ncbi:hypothetical protein MIR68_007640 [Amoeboaphelidium protococcarum]|nr:hypothetical protein MIR68_007640 [Amoeboaphelidium protococcarum]
MEFAFAEGSKGYVADLYDNFIGGQPVYFDKNLVSKEMIFDCSECRSRMILIAQQNIEESSWLYIFGCNSRECSYKSHTFRCYRVNALDLQQIDSGNGGKSPIIEQPVFDNIGTSLLGGSSLNFDLNELSGLMNQLEVSKQINSNISVKASRKVSKSNQQSSQHAFDCYGIFYQSDKELHSGNVNNHYNNKAYQQLQSSSNIKEDWNGEQYEQDQFGKIARGVYKKFLKFINMNPDVLIRYSHDGKGDMSEAILMPDYAIGFIISGTLETFGFKDIIEH